MATKAQQARELTGTQEGRPTLEDLRTALLIAKQGTRRFYWPKSLYPTLEDASAALKAAGLNHGLDFTQYRAKGGFENLAEYITINGQPVKADKPAKAKPAAKAKASKPAKASNGRGGELTPAERERISATTKAAMRESEFGPKQHAAVAALEEAVRVWNLVKADPEATYESKSGAMLERREAVANAHKAGVNLSSIKRHTGMALPAVKRMLKKQGA